MRQHPAMEQRGGQEMPFPQRNRAVHIGDWARVGTDVILARDGGHAGELEFLVHPSGAQLAVNHCLAGGVHLVLAHGRSCLLYYTYNRSEEHTSELQSQSNLVCRLLL